MVILRGPFMTSAWSLGGGGHTIMGINGHMVAFKNPLIRPATFSDKTMTPGWRSATQVRIADIAALMQALGPKLGEFFLRKKGHFGYWGLLRRQRSINRNAMQFSTPDLWLVVLFSRKISEDGTSSATRLVPEEDEGRSGKWNWSFWSGLYHYWWSVYLLIWMVDFLMILFSKCMQILASTGVLCIGHRINGLGWEAPPRMQSWHFEASKCTGKPSSRLRCLPFTSSST